MRCGHTVSAGFIFLCHSEVWWGSFPVLLSPQASPPEPKSGSYCTIAFNQAVSCWLCTIAETVGLSPAATPGVRRGEKTFSTPYRNCCPLTSAGSLVTITGGPYSIGQGNRQSRHHHPRAPQDFPQPLL